MFYRIRCVSCIVHKLYHFLARATPNPIRLPKAKAAPPIIAMPFNPSRKRQNLKQQFRLGFLKEKFQYLFPCVFQLCVSEFELADCLVLPVVKLLYILRLCCIPIHRRIIIT